MKHTLGSGTGKQGKFQYDVPGLVLFVSAVVFLAMPFAALAGDPLDEVDGTEGWDQVVPQAPQKNINTEASQGNIQQEIAQWESIRSTWEDVRKQYLHEKAVQKKMSLNMRKIPSSSPLQINDSNLDQVDTEDWGDAPGEQWLVPSSAVDKAIDSEINESAPKSQPSSPAVSAPAPIIPPPMETNDTAPSAFKQEQKKDLGGGLAPGPADMTSPVPPPPPAHETRKKDDADAGAKAAAEMLRKQQEERKRKEAELAAKKQAEAKAGEAAAARLLKMQQERKKKEQEELRKKEGVKVDDDGQVIDPDLQEEMNEDESD